MRFEFLNAATRADRSRLAAAGERDEAVDEDEVDQLASDFDLDDELLKLAEIGDRKKRRTAKAKSKGKNGERGRMGEVKDRLSTLPDDVLLEVRSLKLRCKVRLC